MKESPKNSLLIITQKVDFNDDNLGFFHRWIEKFSEKLDKVYVICLAEGKYNLPGNVIVFSLGKEKGYSKIRQWFRLQKFLLRYLPQVDGVFVHMCPIYGILSFPLVKIFKRKMILWYTHGSVSFKLKLAEKLMDGILTASLSSCRIKNKKIKVVGHGIDVGLFQPKEKQHSDNFRILFAGRINKTKDQETLIRAVDILVNRQNIRKIKLRIIGHPLVKSEREYLEGLKGLVKNKKLDDCVEFIDGVPYLKMPSYLQQADLFVNPSSTGSLDKVVLEAMAAGCLVLTCNEGYRDILADKYLFERGDAEDLAQKITYLMGAEKDFGLRKIVAENHNLDNLIIKIIQQFHA